MFASNLWLEKIRQVSSSVKLKRQIFFQSMRLYGLPWTLPPRLGIEDSYFLVHFLSHPVSTYHGLLNSQLSTVLDAVIGKLWFLSPGQGRGSCSSGPSCCLESLLPPPRICLLSFKASLNCRSSGPLKTLFLAITRVQTPRHQRRKLKLREVGTGAG